MTARQSIDGKCMHSTQPRCTKLISDSSDNLLLVRVVAELGVSHD
jgi:hypothetical protein